MLVPSSAMCTPLLQLVATATSAESQAGDTRGYHDMGKAPENTSPVPEAFQSDVGLPTNTLNLQRYDYFGRWAN